MVKQVNRIRPQEGFQTKFMATSADIAIGGGAAGSGKSFVELLEGLRHHKNPDFNGLIFRRTNPQILMPGGLWDTSKKIYPFVGASGVSTRKEWTFMSGSKMTFRHLESEEGLDEYQGGQIPLIQWDELTHFTQRMFIYMLTRNRSTSGIRPYMRATCNPDPDSWVANFIEWWIDQETGFPIPERAGVLRYMVNDQGNVVWGNSKQEIFEKAGHVFQTDAVLRTGIAREELVKSVTFIPGSIYENRKLLEVDPGYMAGLLSQDEATQQRLLHGNWKIRSDNKNLFDFFRLNDMFHNVLPDNRDDEYYIIIDHAREGKDLCTIGVAKGWKFVRIDVLPKSNTNDILAVVKKLRIAYNGIPTSNILIDQDGIGVKDFLECHSFFGGSSENIVRNTVNPVIRVGPTKEKRGFQNKRTQLYYLLSEKVNNADIYIDADNIWFHHNALRSERVQSIKIGGREWLVKDLIKEQLRVLRSVPSPESVKKIISKDEHKNALGGMSPDFGDLLMMRGQFEFIPRKKYLKR